MNQSSWLKHLFLLSANCLWGWVAFSLIRSEETNKYVKGSELLGPSHDPKRKCMQSPLTKPQVAGSNTIG